MASSDSGNLKYAVIGILLLLGAGALWYFTQPKEEAQPAAVAKQAPKAPEPARSTAMAEDDLVMPEEESDAGESAPKRKVVIRYVDGDWDCSGDIAPAQIQSLMNDYRAQVRTCYERRLKVNNTLQGNLMLSMKIGSGGQVAASRIGGNLGDAEVSKCVKGLAAKWKLPPPTNGTCAVVKIPFNFTPKSS